MKHAFKMIFSGFLLEFFDINIGTFDIIPDFIGYILIFIGIGKLTTLYPLAHSTKYGRLTTLILMVFSVIQIFISPSSYNQFDPFWIIITFLQSIVLTILVYYLFQIMLVIAQIEEQGDYLNNTRIFYKIYMSTLIIQSFLHPFTFNFSNDTMAVIVIPLGILLLFLYIGFLVRLYTFSKMPTRTEIIDKAGDFN